MRTTAIPILALLTMAAPASPQIWGGPSAGITPAGPGPGSGSSVDRQLGHIENGIRAGRHSGQLSRSERKALRHQRTLIRSLEDRFAQDGLSEGERAELQTRLELLRNDTTVARSQD